MTFFLFLKFDPGILYFLLCIVIILNLHHIVDCQKKRASINKIKKVDRQDRIEEKQAFLLKKVSVWHI